MPFSFTIEHTLIHDLGVNAGLISFLVAMYSLLDTSTDAVNAKRRNRRHGLLGLLFGLGCVLAMQAPLQLQPGLLVDSKTIIIGLAGAYLSAPSALIALVVAALYRAYVGGFGMVHGVAALIGAALLGCWFQRQRTAWMPRIGLAGWLLALGASLAALGLSLLWLLPVSLRGTLIASLVLPVAVFYPAAVFLFGALFEGVVRLRKREHALRESEAYNKLLFTGSRLPFVIMDPQSQKFIDCNQAAADIYQLGTRDAVIGLTPLDVSAPTQYDGQATAITLQRVIGLTLQTGTHFFEWRHQRPSGQPWDAEVFLTAFKHGNRDFIQVSLQDISERKQIETEQRIAAITFESQQGVIVTDAAQKILRINAACSAITGYTADEVVGKTPQVFSSGRHDGFFYQAMWDKIESEGSWSGEFWNRRKNGEIYPQWASVSAVRGSQGNVTHYVASFVDLTQRRLDEERIRHLAFYDALTNLPNRRLLMDRLDQALTASSRNCTVGALLFIDLDHFKSLNDTRGHDVGDLLLKSIAERIQRCVRANDTVARIGGDEFVVLMEGLSGSASDIGTHARRVAEKVLTALSQPYPLPDVLYEGSASVGIALFTGQSDTVEDLLKRADLAMYQAKADGRNKLCFFDPIMQATVMARESLLNDLRHGLQQHQLRLHFQPVVDTAGKTVGAEALVRWQHPVRGLVAPLEFIGLAEETGLIHPLGNWVLEAACQQLVRWHAASSTLGLTMAVNVSAHQFRHPQFVSEVLDIIHRTGVDPAHLTLELTESLLLSNVEETISKMLELKEHGISFALDDFGTGYSSLSYLKRLPLDHLKIDRSFVRDVLVDTSDAAIAKTILALAQSLNLWVIAEGIETTGQRDFLAELGCTRFQGYLFAAPVDAVAFDAMLG